MTEKHRIFSTTFAGVYPLYVQKAERKNRTKEEVDEIICWLTGYSKQELQRQIALEVDFEAFLIRHQQFIQMPPSSRAPCVVSAWKK